MIQINKKIFSLYSLIVFIFSCQEDKSIDVFSYQINNKSEKIEILERYLEKKSGLIDAEYHIWYKDNSSGLIPGPSDYTIYLALKIKPDSLDSWVKTLEPTTKVISTDLWNELKLDKNVWKVESKPEVFLSKSNKEVKLVYRKECLILGIYSTMPARY